jgi:predicted membrane protein (TIGR00267 family)
MVWILVRHTVKEVIGKIRQTRYLKKIFHDVVHDEYTRRAFANNAFDGALTFLGILMGNLVLNDFRPSTIIKIGLSTCLALGMSGAFGRFLSERAERKRSLRQMEKNLFADLGDTSLEREGERKMLTISLVDGVSPALAAVIPLMPFFLAQASIIPVNVSIVVSFVLIFVVLFALGMFLGKTAEENTFLYGGLVVAVGFVTSLIILVASMYFR